jgi:ABC-type Na+ transport system ATPase subunit NatA
VVIAADHVSKWYGQVIGLNDVTLEVSAGITGLLGPNGAGKSTFMKLITGQLKPSKGTIRVLDEPIWQNPALYYRIGFCPEQDAFYERMTGLEWVSALVRLTGVSGESAMALARQAIEMVDLTDAAGKKIGAGARPRTRAVDSRRAARRHGPAGAAPDDQDDQGLGAVRPQRDRLEPHSPRDRIDDVEYFAHQPGQDSRGRQRPSDS